MIANKIAWELVPGASWINCCWLPASWWNCWCLLTAWRAQPNHCQLIWTWLTWIAFIVLILINNICCWLLSINPNQSTCQRTCLIDCCCLVINWLVSAIGRIEPNLLLLIVVIVDCCVSTNQQQPQLGTCCDWLATKKLIKPTPTNGWWQRQIAAKNLTWLPPTLIPDCYGGAIWMAAAAAAAIIIKLIIIISDNK